TDRADPLLEAYSDWPEKIMQHFATTADIAYYNERLDFAVVSASRTDGSTVEITHTYAHEVIGHSTALERFHYFQDSDGTIYVWNHETLLPRAVSEARASVLAANFGSIYLDGPQGTRTASREEEG